jgi:NADH-quinone oxidoreductase subunit A
MVGSEISPYLGILLLVVVAAGFLVTMLGLATWLGPKHKTRTKQLPFECGSVSVGDASDHRFSVRFYLVAMLFILFDIEVIFLYPWAMVLLELGWAAYVEMLLFMLVVVLGLVYVWRRGILDWASE